MIESINMEGKNTPEKFVTDDFMIEVLKSGLETPGAREVFNTWLDQFEARRTSDSCYDIEVSIQRARVYYRAGFLEEAKSDLFETLEGAVGEGEKSEQLRQEAEDLLGEMERGESI